MDFVIIYNIQISLILIFNIKKFNFVDLIIFLVNLIIVSKVKIILSFVLVLIYFYIFNLIYKLIHISL